VAEDSTNPFSQILGALQSKGASTGLRGDKTKGVRKDGKPGDVSPILTSRETERYKKIFGVMKDIMDPGPEADKIAGTKSAAIGNTGQMQQSQKEQKEGGLNWGKIMGGLALGAGVIGAALASLAQDIQGRFLEFGEAILDFGSEVAEDIGHLPAMAAKLAKFIPLKTLKFLPLIGSLISFGLAYQHFKNNQYISGGWELVSGIANLFPGVGTAISIGMDMIKFIYEANAPIDPDTGEKMDFGAFLKMKAKEFGTIALDKIKEGKVPMLSGFWKLGEAIGYFISKDWKGGFKALKDFIPALLGQGDSEQMMQALDAAWSLVSESDIGKKAGEMAGDSWSWMKDVMGEIGDAFLGFFDGIKDWVNDTIKAGKDLIWDMIPDALKPSNALSEDEHRQAAWNAQQQARQQARDRNMTKEEQRTEEIMHLTPLELKAFKKHGMLPSELEGNTIKDGQIYKDGSVTSYDSQDDILAAKRGGPIDKMLDANSAVMSELNDVNKNQLNVLVSILDGVNTIISKSGGSASQVQLSHNPLTQEFYA